MFNWRKPVLHSIYRLAGNPTLRHLKYLKSVEFLSPKKIQQLQDEKLKQLLLHAYRHVPYYRDVLAETAVIKNDNVLLDNFHNIPILTRDILLHQREKLYSDDYQQRRFYHNKSGGSTGEPLSFIQDKNYKAWSMAALFYFHSLGFREIGEELIMLWGSPRDVFKDSEKISTRLEHWLSNTIVLNGFLMSQQRMARYVGTWNKIKPRLVVAYVSTMLEFTRYIQQTGRRISAPKAVFCSAETLSPDMRTFMEEVLHCPVLNQYGSREAGAIAGECSQKEGLHIFSLNNKVEILDSSNQPCKPNEIGEVVITTLNNYSMPLIRYKIGDTAIPAQKVSCSCGRGWPLIQKLTGRQMENFKTKEGIVIPGEFFIHAVGVVYNKGYIKKFQIVQQDYDYIIIKVVVENPEKFNESRGALLDSIRKVMGQQCKIDFEFVDNIEPSKSGKFQYTISEILNA